MLIQATQNLSILELLEQDSAGLMSFCTLDALLSLNQ